MVEGPELNRRSNLGPAKARAARDMLYPWVRLFIGAFAAGLFAGCGRPDNGDFFPIGIYGVKDPAALAELHAAGFNAAFADAGEANTVAALADRARREGMRLMLPPAGLLADAAAVRNVPMAAWYLTDEPDVHGMKPEDLAALDAQVRRRSFGVPTAFVVGDGHAASAYAASGDILMVDWYPVPHLSLTTVGDNVRRTVEAARGKPVWAVLQAMDWRDYPQRVPAKPKVGRFPDIAEIRFMTYDALIAGARGIWYFTYTRPDGRTLPEMPGEWFALRQVVRELAELKPILEGGTRLGTPEALNLGMIGLVVQRKKLKYYILANDTDQKINLPEYYWQPRFRPLFEPYRAVTENLISEGGALWLSPWRVLVLETED